MGWPLVQRLLGCVVSEDSTRGPDGVRGPDGARGPMPPKGAVKPRGASKPRADLRRPSESRRESRRPLDVSARGPDEDQASPVALSPVAVDDAFAYAAPDAQRCASDPGLPRASFSDGESDADDGGSSLCDIGAPVARGRAATLDSLATAVSPQRRAALALACDVHCSVAARHKDDDSYDMFRGAAIAALRDAHKAVSAAVDALRAETDAVARAALWLRRLRRAVNERSARRLVTVALLVAWRVGAEGAVGGDGGAAGDEARAARLRGAQVRVARLLGVSRAQLAYMEAAFVYLLGDRFDVNSAQLSRAAAALASPKRIRSAMRRLKWQQSDAASSSPT
ncbi:hypothetical protein M885DRAFT_556888 [Pelagophyceae sp. CCMP2097]|nr:hypothetical protein M885DRAFT_556888 [Pelagophyceae sp. CCMP2097]